MKKISVIIPCYNVEKYIDRCIASLEAQTIGIDALEIILIDDASTDSTPEHLKEWEKKYENSILLILCEENGRQGRARNLGMQYASADFITFIDSDDWIEKEMLQDMYDVMSRNDTLNFVAGKWEQDFGDGNFCNVPFQEDSEVKYYSVESSGVPLPRKWQGGVVTKLYRKSFLESTGLYFPEGLTYEDNYWATILKYYVTSYALLQKRYYHYFTNEESTARKEDSPHHFDRLVIAMMTDDELKTRGISEKYPLEAERTFLIFYYINTLHIFFTKFSVLPYDIITEMQKEVRRRYPDFMRPEIWNQLTRFQQLPLKTANYDYSRKEWDEIAASYKKLALSVDHALFVQYAASAE